MAIKFINGTSRSTEYEHIAESIMVFDAELHQQKVKKDFLGKELYKKFIQLRSDFEHKLIDKHTLHQFLQPLKDFVLKAGNVFPETHYTEIFSFLQEQKLIN